jgi:hypothetical protein
MNYPIRMKGGSIISIDIDEGTEDGRKLKEELIQSRVDQLKDPLLAEAARRVGISYGEALIATELMNNTTLACDQLNVERERLELDKERHRYHKHESQIWAEGISTGLISIKEQIFEIIRRLDGG